MRCRDLLPLRAVLFVVGCLSLFTTGVAVGADAPPDGIKPGIGRDFPYYFGVAGSTAYVVIDSLPVFSEEGLTPARLKFGTAVVIADTWRLEKGFNSIDVEWTEEGAKRVGTVTTYGLAAKKPAENKPAAEAAPVSEADVDDSAKELQRMSGTWIVAGICMFGKFNPDGGAVIASEDQPDFIPAVPDVIVQGQNKMPDMPLSMLIPGSTHYQFKGNTLKKWGLLPEVTPGNKVLLKPFLHGEVTVEIDATTRPRHLDTYDPRMPKQLRQITTGAYQWQEGNVLVWATEARFGGGLIPRPGFGGIPAAAGQAPAVPDASRIAGFEPQHVKKAAVLYLIRVDPKQYPAPPSRKPAGRNLGGNVF